MRGREGGVSHKLVEFYLLLILVLLLFSLLLLFLRHLEA